jgi:hypothetical protein
MTTLHLTTDGRVFLLPEDGDGEFLGYVLDDYRCPAGLEAEWTALADEYLETTSEGRAELALLKAEYESLIGALR